MPVDIAAETRGRMSTAPWPRSPGEFVPLVHRFVTTWATSTSGGGDGGLPLLLLQAVMVVAMTTMAMAERPARSDAAQ